MFRWRDHLGSFPAWWIHANITPIPNCPPSSCVANYRRISITSVLSQVFERLVSVRLGRFMESSGVIPTSKFSLLIGKAWVPVIHFCACPIHFKVDWREGRRPGSCRLISAQPLIWSAIREFSISSVLWVLEVVGYLH